MEDRMGSSTKNMILIIKQLFFQHVHTIVFKFIFEITLRFNNYM